MYTLIVTPDNRLRATTTCRIVQRSKLCDNIHILLPQNYDNKDMSECQVTMYYTLPVSKEEYTKTLIPSKDIYKDDYLEYIIPADTWITKESGDVQVELVITFVESDAFGEVTQYVRKITDGVIHIASSKNWGSAIADPLLSAVDQRIIQLQMLTERLEEIQEADIENLMMNKADNIMLDENFNLQLKSNGQPIGDKIPISGI